jgi:hypothetical protein
MTLTEADLVRLDGAGFKNFARLNADGDVELRNRNGRCVFLLDGRCDAYAARPEGCRLYPLVLDLGSDRVFRDQLCPHRGDFPITAEQVERLRRSVAQEQIEAGNRRWGGDG